MLPPDRGAIARQVGANAAEVDEVRCSSSLGDEGGSLDNEGGLHLDCRLSVKPGAGLVEAGDAFKASVKAEVEEKTGFKVVGVDMVAGYASGKTPHRRRRPVR